jgi:Tol biopolymer transport system component
VSVSSSGAAADGSSEAVEITADGRYVVFWSWGANLVTGDTNGKEDVFRHDRVTGATIRVSIHSNGVTEGNWASFGPDISDDGRYVAFYSYANNLVDDDTNKCPWPLATCRDVFVHDVWTGTTTRVSESSSGAQGDKHSTYPALSADGSWVAFESGATTLVTGDSNSNIDIFLHELATSETTRVSVKTGGGQIFGGNCTEPAISGDGRFIAFSSAASDVVAGDSNGRSDIFVHDRVTTQTVRISLNTAGLSPNDNSTSPDISDDGRLIVFSSTADDLVPGDTNEKQDIFVYDRQTGETRRVSVSSAGAEGDRDAASPSISPDGRYVVFESKSSTLVSGEVNDEIKDTYLHDLHTGETVRVSQSSGGVGGNGSSHTAGVSNGRPAIAFQSDATNLLDTTYTGPRPAIYVHELNVVINLPLAVRAVTG